MQFKIEHVSFSVKIGIRSLKILINPKLLVNISNFQTFIKNITAHWLFGYSFYYIFWCFLANEKTEEVPNKIQSFELDCSGTEYDLGLPPELAQHINRYVVYLYV